MNFTSRKERFFKLAFRLKFRPVDVPALVFVVLIGTFCCHLQVNAATKNLSVWKLAQNENLLGRRTAYVGENGIKFVYAKENYSLLYAAPDWRLHYFNSDRKTIYSSTLAQWQDSSDFRLKLVKANYFPDNPGVIKGLSHLIAGHKVQSYILKPFDKGHTTKRSDGSTVVETNWDVADEIVLSSQANRLVEATMGQPVGKNFPIYISVLMGDGHRKDRLTTLSVERVTVPADFFQPPKNYAPVKSESEITLGSGLINDIVDDLGKGLGKP